MPITPESLSWIICMGFNVLSMFSKTLWYGYSCLQRGNSCFVLFVSFFKFINIFLYFSKQMKNTTIKIIISLYAQGDINSSSYKHAYTILVFSSFTSDYRKLTGQTTGQRLALLTIF